MVVFPKSELKECNNSVEQKQELTFSHEPG